MPLAALVNGPLICPGCAKDLRKSAANVDKALTDLANSLAALQVNQKMEVQFVLPIISE